jgi:UDP-N-acetylglucosamine 3-dehydrogenase
MVAKLRAGLIGLGSMGRRHAHIMRQLDGVELVVAADPAGDQYHAVEGIPIVRVVDDVLRYRPHYCVVAVPTALHQTIGSALAAAGVHALIEKPLAMDGPTSTKLMQEFEAAGLVGAVGHTEIYNPAVRALQERLEYGLLGTIYHITTRRLGPYPARVKDVGVIKDLATHDIGIVTQVTNRSIVSVMAKTVARNREGHEDVVSGIGLLDDGVVTSYLANWLSPLKERVSVTTGERGCLVADTLNTRLTFFPYPDSEGILSHNPILAEGGQPLVCDGNGVNPLRVEHEAFRDVILGKPARITGLRQGAAIVAVADAFFLSATTDRLIRLVETGPDLVGTA